MDSEVYASDSTRTRHAGRELGTVAGSMGLVRITSWYPNFNGSRFWLATQLDPQNDWTATQNRVNYDVFAQAPSSRYE